MIVQAHLSFVIDFTLWEKSGHAANYAENMFTTHSESRNYAVKRMNCPCHVQDRVILPRIARCNITGWSRSLSSVTYEASKRNGKLKSHWIVRVFHTYWYLEIEK